MGGGSWSASAYSAHTVRTGMLRKSVTENFVTDERKVNTTFLPKNFNGPRESCDSSEHPTSNPIIIGLDVTGSMSSVLDAVVKNVNTLITTIYEESIIPHPQIMFIGFGDVECDQQPAQVTQYESDIRLLTQLTDIYFERGGGGNGYESYTLPWWIAANKTRIDSFTKRSVKGTLFTIGDEPLNPILKRKDMQKLGLNVEVDINTEDLFEEVSKTYNVYHINVKPDVGATYWKRILGERFINSEVSEVHNTILNVLRGLSFPTPVESINIR